MPEENPDAPATGTDDTTDDDKAPTGTEPDYKADAAKWKKLARKHEDQAKANKAELDKLKADGDSGNRSDMEKVQAQLAALTKRAEEAERKALVAEVAQAKGLTAAQASRLRGDSREELEDDADELLDAFTAKPGTGTGDKGGDGETGDGDKPAPGGKPREKLRPGASPEPDAGKTGEQLADEVWKRTHGGI